MFKTDLKVKVKTNYHLDLIDSKTGRIKQQADTHNVFLANWWNDSYNSYHNGSEYFVYQIALGSGTGTPAESDTALFNQLWVTTTSSETIELVNDNEAVKFTSVASFPATDSYVGTVTELGCITQDIGNWTGLFTHALLKDAEGQPISIEKTDTDILVVTVTLTFSYSVSSPWKLLDYPGLIGRKRSMELFGNPTRSSLTPYEYPWQWNYFCLGTEIAHQTAKYGRLTYGASTGNYSFGMMHRVPNSAKAILTSTLTKSTKKYTWATTRLTTDLGESRPIYFNSIIFNNFCYAELPCADIFPSYDIEDIDIGIGDGDTVDFDNPLDWFPENGEVIYKNGTTLVRGADYTIDHRNNQNRLPELAATNNGRATAGVTHTRQSYIPFQRFIADNLTLCGSDNGKSTEMPFTGNYYQGWKSDTPFIFKMVEAREVNTFHVPGWCPAGTITLAYSTDGETWTDVQAFTHTSGTEDLITFNSITAQYWRISGTNTSWSDHQYTNDNAANELFLGYVGDPQIHFTTAPASGDVLTMKVTMDRPFKNGNFVIDCSAEMQLS